MEIVPDPVAVLERRMIFFTIGLATAALALGFVIGVGLCLLLRW